MIDLGSKREVKEWHSSQYFPCLFQLHLGQNYKMISFLLFYVMGCLCTNQRLVQIVRNDRRLRLLHFLK